MMLERFLGNDKQRAIGWEDLGQGAPTIAAIANLASDRVIQMIGQTAFQEPVSDNSESTLDQISRAEPTSNETPRGSIQDTLSQEAKTILFLARSRGVIALRASNQAFDSVDRMLTVHVEVEPDQYRRIGSREHPRQTVRFLEAFVELAGFGLLIHQLYHEFSLSTAGFDVAQSIEKRDIEALLKFAVDPNQKDW